MDNFLLWINASMEEISEGVNGMRLSSVLLIFIQTVTFRRGETLIIEQSGHEVLKEKRSLGYTQMQEVVCNLPVYPTYSSFLEMQIVRS